MTTMLLPPATSYPGRIEAEALTEGPRFVRTRGMSRWHRTRSGERWANGRIIYGTWCGPSVGGSDKAGAFLGVDELPVGEPVCATCDGRAVGAGQEPDGPAGRRLLFTPRGLAPPVNCPGSRTALYEGLSGGRVGRCLVCQDTQPLRAMGGPYDGRYAIVQHPPGAGLIEPCPFHRWKHLTASGDRLTCPCGRELR